MLKTKSPTFEKNRVTSLRMYLQHIESALNGESESLRNFLLEKILLKKDNNPLRLHILQLTGLKYSARAIGNILGYSQKSIEREKEYIKDVVINEMQNWKCKYTNIPLEIPFFWTKSTSSTKVIREFAKRFELDIILALESLGQSSYISLCDNICSTAKMMFDDEI